MNGLVWLVCGAVASAWALAAAAPASAAAAPEPAPLHAVAGRSFYMTELQGELILLGDDPILYRRGLRADVFVGKTPLASFAGVVPGRRLTVSFGLGALPLGDDEVTCVLHVGGEQRRLTACVAKLPPKANAVQIDRVSGGLIVDGLPLFPFGFYNYWPVQPTLAEEEVVKGFNLMSPYHGNEPESLGARRQYLDRAAQLGMKVHYHINSIAVLGDAPDCGEREQALRAEVEAVRDHPALLAWYLSDEPEYNNISPEEVIRTYRIVHQLDPYHPITIVFARPEVARQYAAAMDLVMTDPYPIPQQPPAAAYDAISGLVAEFDGEKPVWIVPQAFGGNEWWQREPTAQEERVMTYLGLLGGATGVQYFVRHGLNGFPKSTITWGECGRLALEVAELTPALLSQEARPEVTSADESIRAGAWRERDVITVLAVNTENRPRMMRLRVAGLVRNYDAAAIFENRTVPVIAGRIEEMIDAYGTRAYEIVLRPRPRGDLVLDPRSLIVNPSFEDNPTVGTPEGCYAHVGTGRGATYFVDARVARLGRHSVRMNLPSGSDGLALSLFPVPVAQGKSYRLSVWAKALAPKTADGQWPVLKLGLYGAGEQTFPLTADWQEYVLEGPMTLDRKRTTPSIALTTPGTAWVDAVQLVEVAGAEAPAKPPAVE
jgi:hypothetical protein